MGNIDILLDVMDGVYTAQGDVYICGLIANANNANMLVHLKAKAKAK